MKAGHILSVGILSVLVWGCNQATQPEQHGDIGRQVVPAVNAATKIGALQAGYGISRAAADSGFDFSDEELQRQMQQIGICDNFIQLIAELGQGGMSTEPSPRWAKVFQCLEKEAQNMSMETAQTPEAIFNIFDKCFCDGSGSVFAAIRAYSFSKYGEPQFNGYSAPVSARGYSAPVSAPGYSAPVTAPGYSAPSL